MAKSVDRKIEVSHVNIRQSISLLVIKLLALDLLAAFFMLTFCLPIKCFNIPLDFDFLFFLVAVIVKMALSFYAVFQWLNNYYEINPEAISHHAGFIYQKKEKYYIKHIREVGLDQGLVGRYLNFGTIELYNWDLKRYQYLYLIHNPLKYYRIIKQLRPNVDEEDAVVREHFTEE